VLRIRGQERSAVEMLGAEETLVARIAAPSAPSTPDAADPTEGETR
jgi:hypothetical protein